ncbi:hypothetical protein KAR91_12465 [Candidatus Pacearchaeota archaeon]|nr:hypothetical protein [Candidatus Pacearchaeota archaeon]
MFKDKVYNFVTIGTTTIAAVAIAAGIYNVYDIRRDLRESRETYGAMMKCSEEFSKLSLKLGSPIEALIKQAEDAGLVERIKKEEGNSNINNF